MASRSRVRGQPFATMAFYDDQLVAAARRTASGKHKRR